VYLEPAPAVFHPVQAAISGTPERDSQSPQDRCADAAGVFLSGLRRPVVLIQPTPV
jgi:hypothetical protein